MDNQTENISQSIPPQSPPAGGEPQQNIPQNISWLKTISIGFSIVSFCLAIGIGGYFLAANKNQSVSENQTISPTVIQSLPTPPPAGGPTANWKTYTNTKYNYSLNYLKNWILKKENDVIDSVTTNTLITSDDYVVGQPTMGGGFIPGAETGARLEIVVSQNPNVKSYTEFKNFEETKSTEFPLNYFASIKTTTIDGIEATEKIGGKPYKGLQYYVYFFRNGTIYKIYLTSSTDQQSLFDQILSTFKFTDQNQIPTPTCMQRPACLDANPRCLIAEPASGWCPK